MYFPAWYVVGSVYSVFAIPFSSFASTGVPSMWNVMFPSFTGFPSTSVTVAFNMIVSPTRAVLSKVTVFVFTGNISIDPVLFISPKK